MKTLMLIESRQVAFCALPGITSFCDDANKVKYISSN